jgi:hypothetical protein
LLVILVIQLGLVVGGILRNRVEILQWVVACLLALILLVGLAVEHLLILQLGRQLLLILWLLLPL